MLILIFKIVVSGLLFLWFFGLNIIVTARALNTNFIHGCKGEDRYQAWWAGVMGPIIIIIAWFIYIQNFKFTGSLQLIFLIIALGGVILEEAICFCLKLGAFEHPGNRIQQFLGATTALFLACFGGWIAYQRLELDLLSAVLLFGFAGYLLEAFPFQKLYRTVPPKLLYGAYPPIVAGHYILLMLPAYVLVQPQIEEAPRWDHPLKWVFGLALPFIFPGILCLFSQSVDSNETSPDKSKE